MGENFAAMSKVSGVSEPAANYQMFLEKDQEIANLRMQLLQQQNQMGIMQQHQPPNPLAAPISYYKDSHGPNMFMTPTVYPTPTPTPELPPPTATSTTSTTNYSTPHATPLSTPSRRSPSIATTSSPRLEPCYTSESISLDAMRSCVTNDRLDAYRIGNICKLSAKSNFQRHTSIMKTFVKENCGRVKVLGLSEKCYEAENAGILAIANSVFQNMVSMRKGNEEIKQARDNFDIIGSTSNVSTMFFVDARCGEGYKTGHTRKIGDLQPPRDGCSELMKMKHYMIYFLGEIVDEDLKAKLTSTSVNFFVEDGDETNANDDIEEVEEEEPSDESDEPSQVSKHGSRNENLVELNGFIKRNMFDVFLQFYKLSSPLLTDRRQWKVADLENDPDFLNFGTDWDARIEKMAHLRKKYKDFKKVHFKKTLKQAVYDFRRGTWDPKKKAKKFKGRERDSKVRINARNMKKRKASELDPS